MNRHGMVLELGEGVVRSVIESSFLDDVNTLRATEMHMALVEPRTRFKRGWARMVAVEAEPACWEVLARWARGRSRASMGERKARHADARRLQTLADKITRELLRLANHPAYRDLRVLGPDTTVLPAYRCGGVLGPTPSTAMAAANFADAPLERGHLDPVMVRIRGKTYTDWRWVSAPE